MLQDTFIYPFDSLPGGIATHSFYLHRSLLRSCEKVPYCDTEKIITLLAVATCLNNADAFLKAYFPFK